MKYNSLTESFIYQMEQTTAYCREKGEQYLKAINAGLTIDQFVAIDILSNNSGICQMDLAKMLLRDRVYTSRILSTLEEKGLVERKIRAKGKVMIKEITLTKDGLNLHSEIKGELKAIYDKVFEEITDAEMEVISNGIMKLKDCISKFTIMPL